MSRDRDYAAETASIRDEYRRREIAPQHHGVYSFENPAHAALVFERERAILRALTAHLAVPLGAARVLDVGASTGVSLALLAGYGASASNLHGVDIVESRIRAGQALFPAFDLRVTDGVELPYPDGSFDLVQQITVLSSVPSPDMRAALAAEMLRVLVPGGLVVSYDVAPVAIWPRLLNRALSLRARAARPGVAGPPSPDAAPAVELRAPTPLDVDELRRLFAGTDERETRALMLYRPLAERLVRHEILFAAASSFRPFATARLYVAAKR